MVFDTLASHHRAQFHYETSSIVVGQNNTSQTQAKANEKAYYVWSLNSPHGNTKTHHIQTETITGMF
jgi:hypothetical protein